MASRLRSSSRCRRCSGREARTASWSCRVCRLGSGSTVRGCSGLGTRSPPSLRSCTDSPPGSRSSGRRCSGCRFRSRRSLCTCARRSSGTRSQTARSAPGSRPLGRRRRRRCSSRAARTGRCSSSLSQASASPTSKGRDYPNASCMVNHGSSVRREWAGRLALVFVSSLARTDLHVFEARPRSRVGHRAIVRDMRARGLFVARAPWTSE